MTTEIKTFAGLEDLETSLFSGDKEAAENLQVPMVPYSLTAAGQGRLLRIYLTDNIKAPPYYSQALSILMQMTKNDRAEMYLHTPGGLISSASYISHLIENSAAEVTGIASGQVMSAGTMILSACDKVEVRDDASFMFHHSRGMYAGKTLAAESRLNGINSIVTSWVERMHGLGWLTDDELERITNKNEDVFISGREMNRRLNGGSDA